MKKTFTLMLIALCLSAISSMAEESPSEVVRKFCMLDYEGARLSTKTYSAILPLIAYPAEPGWDTVVGIRGYALKNEMINGDVAEVVVEYEIDQIWPEGDLPNRQETFKLVKYGDAWKIQEYIIYPRVSAIVLCRNHSRCSNWANKPPS